MLNHGNKKTRASQHKGQGFNFQRMARSCGKKAMKFEGPK
jgi:hypothetical protein